MTAKDQARSITARLTKISLERKVSYTIEQALVRF